MKRAVWEVSFSTHCRKRPDLAPALQEKIQVCLGWIESHTEANQALPEQVAENLNVPSYYPVWVERWGHIASPLLWSHAKHIILQAKKSFRPE